MLIILLVLVQNFELHMCRQLMVYPATDKRSPDKLLSIGGSAAGEVTLPEANTPADDKRAGGSRSAPSQPEEIFSAPADEGYDEYPMVVPKRAALLLDRLMVALHHALEQERSEQRIGDFFGDRNILGGKFGESHNGMEPHQIREDGMYSDDDSGSMLDYDFKDLNQINRATGETKISVNAKELSEKSGRRSIWDVHPFRFSSWYPAYPAIRIRRWPSVLALLFQCRQLLLKLKHPYKSSKESVSGVDLKPQTFQIPTDRQRCV
ncbi:uncharacterized protein LOC120454997 isoform X1 [Drosophila santomea]|uniref:uncharacterized protein LOC120454997 isoform X1 n=1 Tax=Drosophila santomea TaxID=129105 RepID=UPI0019534152|nr:uncharacterized protein LOC120454997 isoform X1 [Drosophila santomea]